ncbi:MAG: hypothetical protein R3F04_05065 [Lysobacteraceae bacterium]
MLFNPLLALGAGVGAWLAVRHGKHPGASALAMYSVQLWWISATIGWVILQAQNYPQSQNAWLAIMLPLLIASAYGLKRSRQS